MELMTTFDYIAARRRYARHTAIMRAQRLWACTGAIVGLASALGVLTALAALWVAS